MPFLALFTLILISCLSHYLRDERLPLLKNSLLSTCAVVWIVALASIKFGFTADFWGDVLLLVVYVFLLLKELLDVLLYAISADSPIARGDEVRTFPVSASCQNAVRDEMEPRG
jgi:hypothetical protein